MVIRFVFFRSIIFLVIFALLFCSKVYCNDERSLIDRLFLLKQEFLSDDYFISKGILKINTSYRFVNETAIKHKLFNLYSIEFDTLNNTVFNKFETEVGGIQNYQTKFDSKGNVLYESFNDSIVSQEFKYKITYQSNYFYESISSDSSRGIYQYYDSSNKLIKSIRFLIPKKKTSNITALFLSNDVIHSLFNWVSSRKNCKSIKHIYENDLLNETTICLCDNDTFKEYRTLLRFLYKYNKRNMLKSVYIANYDVRIKYNYDNKGLVKSAIYFVKTKEKTYKIEKKYEFEFY